MTTPTIPMMLKVYLRSAEIEYLKCGRPSKGTIRNTICGVRVFIAWLNGKRVSKGLPYKNLDDNFPLVSIIKPVLIHKFLADLLHMEIKPITAMTYISQLRQLFARWVLPYYRDEGWKIPDFPDFGKRPQAPRYIRPSSELLEKLKNWYTHLPSGNVWFISTMMLEFAMRNSDILRLRKDNFIDRDGRIFLNYTPHKTAQSSGRIVKWPVHPQIWERIKEIMKGSDLPILDNNDFNLLNKSMRELGFTGTKGAYELRKICIDHVYQKFGAEMAVSISGDNIRTILHYYADASQPNIGEVRITDLL